MLRYIFNRLILTLFVLLMISVAVFVISHLSGDPVYLMVPPEAKVEDIEILRKALGLDQPLHIQYWNFISKAVQGDFGSSLWQKQPAIDLVLGRLPATLELSALAMLIATAVAIPLGILAAVRKDSIFDRLSMVLAVVGQSAPNFWIGIILIFVFAVYLRWLPSSGRGTWMHVIMPAITLAAFPMARLARLTRSAMLDELGQDYIETARAKGLKERVVILVHALRNVANSLLTVLGLQIGALMGGAIIVESVFEWPGLGNLVVQAIFARDFPLVQAAVFFIAVSFVLINLIVDLLYGLLDPRIKY